MTSRRNLTGMMVTVGVAIPNAKMAKIGPYYYWYLRVTWGSPILRYPYIYMYNYIYICNQYQTIYIYIGVYNCICIYIYIYRHIIYQIVLLEPQLSTYMAFIKKPMSHWLIQGFWLSIFGEWLVVIKKGDFGEAIWDIVFGMYYLKLILTI